MEITPNSVLVWSSLGIGYYCTRDYEAAIRCFCTVLEFEQNNTDALSQLGMIHLNQQKNIKMLNFTLKELFWWINR